MSKPKKHKVVSGKRPAGPAPTIARHAKLLEFDSVLRAVTYATKIGESGGNTADIGQALLSGLGPGFDPSSASTSGYSSATYIDDRLDHGASFVGGKAGARQRESLYLEALLKHLPHENNYGLWTALRTIVENPQHVKNPTPGDCPFGFRHDGAKFVVLKGSKPYPYKTFANTMGKLRKRNTVGP